MTPSLEAHPLRPLLRVALAAASRMPWQSSSLLANAPGVAGSRIPQVLANEPPEGAANEVKGLSGGTSTIGCAVPWSGPWRHADGSVKVTEQPEQRYSGPYPMAPSGPRCTRRR
jgi:hypothetical protein